jgi:murein DD-endopeptidase MepM/ murein hydrolase activator NlpD
LNKNIFLSKTALAVLLILIAAAFVVFIWVKFFGSSENQLTGGAPSANFPSSAMPSAEQSMAQPAASASPSPNVALLSAPFSDWQERVTKKPFGIFVTPTNSPVSPERFSGFHTGVDFETFADEQSIDVVVKTACAGPLVLKKYATGYGGVAVQSCKFENQDVTIIYGHLRLTSIQAVVGQQLSVGEQLGVLGKGYGTETDGERKHLHLGIHKGGAINILGYVQKQADLAGWLDATKYF